MHAELWRQAAGSQERSYFFELAVRLPRQTLVDRAWMQGSGEAILVVDGVLTALEAWQPRGAKVLQIGLFWGFTTEEAAEILGVTVRQARRDWSMMTLVFMRKLDQPKSGG